jgi:hypothetical protein
MPLESSYHRGSYYATNSGRISAGGAPSTVKALRSSVLYWMIAGGGRPPGTAAEVGDGVTQARS